MTTPKKGRAESSEVIGFRLEPDAGSVLAARAAALGVSRHELARQYVIQMLAESDSREAVVQAIRTLNREIQELREDVSLSTQTLLVSAGKVNPSDAEAWAADNLKPR